MCKQGWSDRLSLPPSYMCKVQPAFVTLPVQGDIIALVFHSVYLIIYKAGMKMLILHYAVEVVRLCRLSNAQNVHLQRGQDSS